MASRSIQSRVSAARKGITVSNRRTVAGTINPKPSSTNAKDIIIAKKLGKDGSIIASKKTPSV